MHQEEQARDAQLGCEPARRAMILQSEILVSGPAEQKEKKKGLCGAKNIFILPDHKTFLLPSTNKQKQENAGKGKICQRAIS